MTRILNKPVRLADIARAGEVSISTVSLALSDHPRIGEETKRRLRQLSREMGYRRPGEQDRQAGRGGRSGGRTGRGGKRFGCLLIGSPLRDEVNTELLEGLTATAAAVNARIELGSVAAGCPEEDALAEAARFASRLDGVIVSGFVSPRLLASLEAAHLPHVVIGHVTGDTVGPPPGRTQIVGYDELAMGRVATRCLLGAGHQQVAFISETAPKNLWNDRWLTGYRVAHLDHSRPIDERLVHRDMPLYAGAGPAIERLLKLKQPPTAFVVPDARVGRTAVDELKVRGVEVRPGAFVVGSWSAIAKRHGVSEMGLIQPDPYALAQVAMEHLSRLCDAPPKRALEIVVPFTTSNLPAPGAYA